MGCGDTAVQVCSYKTKAQIKTEKGSVKYNMIVVVIILKSRVTANILHASCTCANGNRLC